MPETKREMARRAAQRKRRGKMGTLKQVSEFLVFGNPVEGQKFKRGAAKRRKKAGTGVRRKG
ncbi:MAG: hypothetical protein GY906_24260 [bacterium]|nr:hypothetical protein [bacterium]